MLLLNTVLLAFLLAHSVYRDIQMENQYPGDLRNRVVGARLQKDGKLPYHYHWQIGDGIKYYNQDEDSWLSPDGSRENKIPLASDVNKITASPFTHELLYPICDLPQRTISRIWLWLQYILWAAMIGMIAGLTPSKEKKWLLLNIGVLFTATEAWKNLIAAGQIYLFVAFLICCLITALVNSKKPLVILGGLIAAMFVLTRPIGIVIFIPFIFSYKKNLLFLSAGFGSLIIYGLFIFISPYEKALYEDYLNAMNMQVQLHQKAANGLPPAHIGSTSKFSNVEGFDMADVYRLSLAHPIKLYSENGNIFVIYYKIFHRKLPLAILISGMICTVSLLCILFFIHYRKFNPQNLQILLFGFLLYMIVEIFNPIYHHQYNTVQWFPLVLAGFLLLPEWKHPIFFLLILGLVLNIVNIAWLPMRHTLGEFCWLTGLMLLVFSSRIKPVT